MVISNMSLFLKYFICIDAIALDYRVNPVLCLLHWRNSQNLLVCIMLRRQRRIAHNYRNDSKAIFQCGGDLRL